MSAVAFGTTVGFEHRLPTAPRRPAMLGLEGGFVEDRKPATQGDIEPWELHSELVLVCPKVCERARELLPERDPDAFLARPREPVLLAAGAIEEAKHTTSLPFPVAVVGYAFWRLLGTARIALFTVGGVVMLALLAEVLH